MPAKTARDYITDLIKGYDEWFWSRAAVYERKFSLCFWLGLIFGVLATITAAFPKSIFQDVPGGGRDFLGWLVVVFTTLSTLFNATLLPRYKSLFELRDTGRIKLDEIKQMHELAEYSDGEQLIMKPVVKIIAQIEADFGGSGKPGDK